MHAYTVHGVHSPLQNVLQIIHMECLTTVIWYGKIIKSNIKIACH